MNDDTKKTLVTHKKQMDGHEITVTLDEAQRLQLSRLTGRDLTQIKIGIQDLADIGDLVAN
ncbi:hypothetical protein [Peteryoungia ipomoeae]|uniref:Uncharacterized protein n=1 Tax=Peteryoungia ipomoeae TaxID=1210932 RepID=A0A4S8P059_9HYPH|nr:hypothetical protein [Peteryoungia ipomoeae]THV20884.1 hypothetical protein FAA97_16935 [Peteryoungia ipomoeae]